MPKILPKAWYNKIVDELAIKYNKDPRVIEYITHYPFSFLKQVVVDEDTYRAVRLKHLGVFFMRHPDLKNIVYTKRVDRLKRNVAELVEANLFGDEMFALEVINNMSKAEINKFYKTHIKLMKQI